MKERPILFSAPMIRAILSGSKTQTRRVVKPRGADTRAHRGKSADALERDDPSGSSHIVDRATRCPYGVSGDRLWCKETWAPIGGDESLQRRDPRCIRYRADDEGNAQAPGGRWRSPLFMPRWASRITLEVTAIRAERLQDIGEADAIAEGLQRTVDRSAWQVEDDRHRAASPVDAYAPVWETINGAGSWATNPVVWVVEFNRVW